MDNYEYKQVMREFYSGISNFIMKNPKLIGELEEKDIFFSFFNIEEDTKKKMLFDWFIFDYTSEVLSKNVLQGYLETVSLGKGKDSLYNQFLNNIYSVFEIKALKTGKEMRLYDLIHHKEYQVKETSLTRNVEKGECGILRIIPFKNYYILSGMGHIFPQNMSQIIKLSVSDLKDTKQNFQLTPLTICEIFYPEEKREVLPVKERFMLVCQEAGLGKTYVKEVIEEVERRVKNKEGNEDIIKKIFAKIRPDMKVNQNELIKVFNDLWNSFVYEGEPYFKKGHMEKTLISLFMTYVQNRVKPERFKNIKYGGKEISKLQKKWFNTPKQELNRKTPKEVILEERQKLGNPLKEIKFKFGTTEIVQGEGIVKEAEELFYKGRKLLSENRPTEAIEVYKEYIAINPKNPVVWQNIGLGYMLLLDKNNAKNCLEKALEINPNYKIAKDNLKILNKTTLKDLKHMAKNFRVEL